MGVRCSTMCKEDGTQVETEGKAQSKDMKFWHEKMRFSRASQTLFEASVRGDAKLAAQAVRGFGDPNCCSGKGLRPLQVAISCGHTDLVDLLLKSAADINGHTKETPPPLVLAAGTGDLGLFEMLLGHGADLNAVDELVGETALTRSAERGHSAICHSILSRGSPGFQKLLAQRPRAGRQGDGCTALHLAAGHGFREICDRLLGVGAEPNAVDKRGRMPLHCAAEMKHLETCTLLLTFGSVASGQDRQGQSALHLAAGAGTLAIVDLLVRCAAEVDARCTKGRTPMHLAASEGHEMVCRLLLAQAATPNITDESGRSPFDHAFRESRVRCCRVLLDAGAEVSAVQNKQWMPPYTEFEPNEHARLRSGKSKAADDSDHELVGC